MKKENGQYMTPPDLAELMARLLVKPCEISKNKITVYDSSFGTSALLLKTVNQIKSIFPDKEIKCYGSEIDKELFKTGKNALKDEGVFFKCKKGDALAADFFENKKYFDYICINPPMGVNFDIETIKKDYRFNSLPVETRVDSQMLFLYEGIKKLGPSGRMVALQTASSFDIGDADSCASKIREYIFKNDLLEAIIALPDYIFDDTRIPTFIWMFNRNKTDHRKGYVQLIDATKCFSLTGVENSKKKQITANYVDLIEKVYLSKAGTDICPTVIVKSDAFGVQELTIKVNNEIRIVKAPLDIPYWTFLRRIVMPQFPNATIDKDKIKNYYSINFNEHFCAKEIKSIETLKDFATLIQGYHFKSENLTDNYTYPVIRISNIASSGVNYSMCLGINETNEIIEKYRIHKDDILIAMSGTYAGRCVLIDEEPSTPVYTNQRVGIIRSNHSLEVFKELTSNQFKEWLQARLNNTVVPNINANDILDYPISL